MSHSTHSKTFNAQKTAPSKGILYTGILLAIMSLPACSLFSKAPKPKTYEPTKLTKIQNPVQVLTPIAQINLRPKDMKKVLVSDLQPAIDQDRVFAVSASGQVIAYDLTAQRPLWQTPIQEIITGGVAYDPASRTLIVSTRTGKVLALNSDNGQIRWQQTLSGTVLTPALIQKNRVLLSANDGILHGLSLQTGKAIWQFSTQVPNISIRGIARPTLLDQDTALFATADGRIHAITVDAGLPKWSRQIGIATGTTEIEKMRDVDGSPLVDNNTLFAISYSGQLISVDLATRQVNFVQKAASLKSLTVLNQQVIATTLDGKVVAFDKQSGDPLWQNSDLLYRNLTNPVAVGRYIAVGDFEGKVHLIDPLSSQIVSRVSSQGALSQLIVSGNRLTTQSHNGQVSVWQF